MTSAEPTISAPAEIASQFIGLSYHLKLAIDKVYRHCYDVCFESIVMNGG